MPDLFAYGAELNGEIIGMCAAGDEFRGDLHGWAINMVDLGAKLIPFASRADYEAWRATSPAA